MSRYLEGDSERREESSRAEIFKSRPSRLFLFANDLEDGACQPFVLREVSLLFLFGDLSVSFVFAESKKKTLIDYAELDVHNKCARSGFLGEKTKVKAFCSQQSSPAPQLQDL